MAACQLKEQSCNDVSYRSQMLLPAHHIACLVWIDCLIHSIVRKHVGEAGFMSDAGVMQGRSPCRCRQ